MRSKSLVLAGLIVSFAPAAAMAHHSGAMFDRKKEVTLVGTLKEIQWTNPHGWIELMVPGADGKPVQWSIEGPRPYGFAKMGLKRNPPYPAPGDKITIVAHPLRDGRTGGSFITMTLADGKTYVGAAVPGVNNNPAAAQPGPGAVR